MRQIVRFGNKRHLFKRQSIDFRFFKLSHIQYLVLDSEYINRRDNKAAQVKM